ncbi:HIT family protein [Dyadobacter chenwenxiniae]|uniref:HIT family protein n=1 Tax=Dyadobacter chenwenxiniae TaxID=2906456 RepID=A0A9X1PJ51_9BACT|nr:HIT family protein [Dyadobacter chenwenxiniae]MCF0061310.1 HIT family protein [Dyadobacter chenwenxiniae]UON81132.1 HIT family protein [Dyadobacter chenwenxiniae]
MASIFSKIVKGEIPSHKIAETDDFLAFLDAFPITAGHTLVIPKREVDYIFDLEQKEYSDLFLFARSIVPALQKVVPCLRIGLTVIGLEVPHTHIHLLPLNSMADADFSKKMNTSQEQLAALAAKIRAEIR